MADRLLVVPTHAIALVTVETQHERPDIPTRATRDLQLIREWASRRGAEPATGERTASGEKTVEVNDGDAGIRFNYPGFAPYRPISWEEWFDYFSRHDLTFVFERDPDGGPPSNRCRLMKTAEIERDLVTL